MGMAIVYDEWIVEARSRQLQIEGGHPGYRYARLA